VKVQGKLNVIFESMLMLSTENGLCWSKLQLAKVAAFFETVVRVCWRFV